MEESLLFVTKANGAAPSEAGDDALCLVGEGSAGTLVAAEEPSSLTAAWAGSWDHLCVDQAKHQKGERRQQKQEGE